MTTDQNRSTTPENAGEGGDSLPLLVGLFYQKSLTAMTTEEIQNRINDIEKTAWDDESAHRKEDALRAEFIKYITTLEIPSLAEKARMVLSTNKIGFSRWYA